MKNDDLNRKDYLAAQAAMLAAETGIEVAINGDGDVDVDLQGGNKLLLTQFQARLFGNALCEAADLIGADTRQKRRAALEAELRSLDEEERLVAKQKKA